MICDTGSMITSRVAGKLLAIAAASLVLAGCFGDQTPAPQETASTVMTLDELQGSDVELVVGETLEIDTQEEDASVYDAMILDSSIAAYQPARDGSQPRIEAVAVGTTDVLLGDPEESADEVSFTLVVTR